MKAAEAGDHRVRTQMKRRSSRDSTGREDELQQTRPAQEARTRCGDAREQKVINESLQDER